MKIGEIAESTGGALVQGLSVVDVRGISTDSRTIRPGELFFALRGPNYNGHVFVRDALEKGVLGAVVETTEGMDLPGSANIIVVGDTLRDLGDCASYIRRRFAHVPLVAVSGSTGKTTTKEMIASILKRSRTVLKTEGNRNNLVGLPLTIAGLEAAHRAAVVELGISEPREMERLVEISSPDVALLTNIGRGHLETMGTIERVAEAKGELFRSPGPGCVRVVNLDDGHIVRAASGRAGGGWQRITYSLSKEADVRVKSYKIFDGLEGVEVVLDVRGEAVEARLKTPGLLAVTNALAAVAATLPFGPSPNEIAEGLSTCPGVKRRMDVVSLKGFTVLDDTYNANPDSVAAALKALAGASGRKVAVLGDMLELGPASARLHREAGGVAAELGIEVIVAVGQWSREVIEGAVASGFDSRRAHCFEGKKEALGALKGFLIKEGDFVLVKGSRAVGLEDIVEGLKDPVEVIHEACG